MNKLATLLLVPLAACSAGNAETGEVVEARGRGPTREFAATGFTGVAARGSDAVEVRVGPAFSVRAQGPADELDELEVRRDGDTLLVGRRKRIGWSGGGEGVTVFVTMPRMEAATVAGSGGMRVDRVEGARFEGAVAGSGDLSVGRMRVEEAELSVAGSGDLTGAGAARKLRMSIAGSGSIDARALSAREAEVSIAGSGDARAAVDGPASVSIVGSGDVDLGERARCTTSKMGSGEVRCG